MRKYGGVNNQQSLNEIHEAMVISSPCMRRITKKQSRASIFFDWLVYLVISYIFTDLLIMIITDVNNRIDLPLWAIFILPAVPFILTLLFKILSVLSNKKHTNHKD